MEKIKSHLRQVIIFPLRAYQVLISPLLGQHCRFYPSCSHYAIEAIEKRGIFTGICLATWRLLRCQPFSQGGVDPVPCHKKEE